MLKKITKMDISKETKCNPNNLMIVDEYVIRYGGHSAFGFASKVSSEKDYFFQPIFDYLNEYSKGIEKSFKNNKISENCFNNQKVYKIIGYELKNSNTVDLTVDYIKEIFSKNTNILKTFGNGNYSIFHCL